MPTGQGQAVESADGMSHDLLTAAREWYDAGFAVIPSHPDGSKRPFGRWRDYQHERPHWSQVESWLSTGTFSGIGVICGRASGDAELVEIEGPATAAVERLGRVMAQAAKYDSTDLMATVARGCVEQSAGGGLHMFIRIIDGPAKPNTKLGMAGTGPNRHVVAETRGEGGFVIVAPTPARKGHAEGTSYLFLQGSTPAGTPAITAEQRDELHLLLTLALDEPEPAGNTGVPPSPERHLFQNTTPIEQGTPFDVFRQRTTWAQILEPLGWRRGHTDGEGHTHWTRPGGTGFDGTSATTLEDGPMYVFSTSTDLPAERGLSKEWVHAHYHHGGDLSAASRALRDAGYGAAPVPPLAPWEAPLPAVADMTPEEVAAEVKANWVGEHLPLLDWEALWADDTEEEWIVEPLLAARRLVALYSAPKVGKSLLMLELAAGMADGRPLLGNPPTEPIRTLYVDFENDPRGDVRSRLESMGYRPEHLANLCYLSFPTMGKLDTATGAEHLMAAISHYRCKVVVVDTVSRSVEGDENENDTWLNFYRHTGLRLKQAGISLIRLDHSGKDETKGQRGGSAKSGDVDAVWRMSKTGEELFTLVCEAQRFAFTDKVVDLQRLDEPHLHHRRTMDKRREIESEILPKYAEAGIPRDVVLGVREVKRRMNEARVPFTNGQVTKATLEKYRNSIPTFTPQSLTGGE